MTRVQPNRLIWLLGALSSFISAGALAVALMGEGSAFGLSTPSLLHFAFQALSWFCLAHLLARGLGLRLLPLLAAVSAAALALALVQILQPAAAPPGAQLILQLVYGSGRVIFGLLFLLSVHHLPAYFRAYGMVPILSIAMVFLAGYARTLAFDTATPRAAIEITGALLLAGLFVWSLRRVRQAEAPPLEGPLTTHEDQDASSPPDDLG
jgi:hypothetical protein